MINCHTGGHSDRAIDEVLSTDCSTLDELEDFIDRSFQNANILTQNNHTNIFPARSTDSSTPSLYRIIQSASKKASML